SRTHQTAQVHQWRCLHQDPYGSYGASGGPPRNRTAIGPRSKRTLGASNNRLGYPLLRRLDYRPSPTPGTASGNTIQTVCIGRIAGVESVVNMDKVTVPSLKAMKREGRKIVALTCYDFTMAHLLNEAGADLWLVGDSLGMGKLGYLSTLP